MQTKEYIISLNEKELRVLLTALGKRPFEEVYELIEKIVTSTSGQTTPEAKGKSGKK